MINKILNIVKQLEEVEKRELYEYIRGQYVREEKDGMLRDDIKDKVVEIIYREFEWLKPDVVEEDMELRSEMDELDIIELSVELTNEFDVGFVHPDMAMRWVTVSDVVNCIEDELENV